METGHPKAYFGDGRTFGLNIAGIVIDGSIGPPDTVDRACILSSPIQTVAFGFPISSSVPTMYSCACSSISVAPVPTSYLAAFR